MRHQTLTHADDKISLAGLSDGRHLVMETPGAVKIYANVANGETTSFEAEDAAGTRQGLLAVVPDSADTHTSPDGFCEVCTYDPTADTVFCYTLLDCPPIFNQLKGPHTPSPIPFPS